MQQTGVPVTAVQGLASIDIKQEEPGLLALAEAMGVPIRFFPQRALQVIDVPNPSSRVAAKIGAPSVCEAAALALAMRRPGPGARLVLEKLVRGSVTIALAAPSKVQSPWLP